MANLEIINVGLSPNDGLGDPIRTAFEKTNTNFGLINAEVGNLAVNIVGAKNTSELGTPVYAGVSDRNLQFKPLIPGTGIAINSTDTTISISSTIALELQGTAGSFVTVDGNGGLTVNSVWVYDAPDNALSSFADINLNLNRIRNVANPSSPQDVATKAYVDSSGGGGGGGLSSLTISKDNVPEGTARNLNFLGTGISVVQATSDRVDVSISAGTDTTAVQSIVGAMFTNNVNEGITTTYDSSGKKINISVHDFAIELQGAVTGSATVSDFNNNVIIQTAAAFLKGLTVSKNAVDVGPQNSVTAFNFVGDNITITRDNNTITVAVAQGLTDSDVRNEIGSTVKGVVSDPLNPAIVTESGITTRYVPNNNTLELGVRDFNIALSGAVTGNATVSRLHDINIVTTSNFIEGLTLEKAGLYVGNPNGTRTLNFVGDNITLTPIDDSTVTIEVAQGLTDSDVRNEIGTTVKGTISDPLNPAIVTESGITTRYLPNNNTLELGVRDFNIALSGAVTGNATVSRLHDINIITSSNFIEGLTLTKDGLQVSDPHSVKTLNFKGDNIAAYQTGSIANIEVTSIVTGDQVSDVLNPRMLGKQDGLSISFDALNKIYNYRLDPITIKLAGAVSGTGTITFDGSGLDGNVTINTVGGSGGGGVTVADEGNVSGTASVINFVGGGITTAVSLDGQVATVYVPNSPAAEPFITATQGSENIPNARLLKAGTGIAINDAGPGGAITISANNDAILAKSTYSENGTLVAEQFGINIIESRWIVPIMQNDVANNRVNLNIYYLNDAWYRQGTYDAGSISNNEGPILDFGVVVGGILETTPDLGFITN